MAKGSDDPDVLSKPEKDLDYLTVKLQREIIKKNRRCGRCGAPVMFGIHMRKTRLEMFLSINGVVGMQELRCHRCDNCQVITSCETNPRIPIEKRLQLRDFEVELFAQKVNHYDIIHDLLELLHVAAIGDPKKRKARHKEVAGFMMQKAKVICEEWCRPEHNELRYKKFLIMYRETVFNADHKPELAADVSEQYKEMYQMMTKSFHSNKTNVELLLCLMKETLFDNPIPSAFMMWTYIAMLHADHLDEFKEINGEVPDLVNKTYYSELMERFASVDIPVGLKKIPVVFVLFEIPRFYHYVEFYNQKVGRGKSHPMLSDAEFKSIKDIEDRMKFLKEQEEEEEGDPGPMLITRDRFKRVLDDHLRKADEKHVTAPDGIHQSLVPSEIQAMDRATGIANDEEESAYLKSLMNKLDIDPVQLKKQTSTDTHMKIDDYEVSIQSTMMTHFVKPAGSTKEYTQEEMDNAKHLNKFIDSTKITEIDPDTGNVKVYERVSFKSTDDDGKETETVLMQTNPKRSRIVDYDKKTFKLSNLGKYKIVPVDDDEPEIASSNPPVLPMLEAAVEKPPVEPPKPPVEPPKPPVEPPKTPEPTTENPPKPKPKFPMDDYPLRLPEIEEMRMRQAALEKERERQALLKVEDPPTEDTTAEISEKPSATAINNDESTTESVETGASDLKVSKKPHLPRSKRPHFKYGMKWRKNKMTYDVDKVTDSDSETEEEYMYYPCKLLGEYVESQKIVETAPKDLSTDVITLAEFLEKRDIHHSLWTIKKKYIQNELFVVLDIARESENARLPLVSASNNRGVSVPVLPILNPTSDSSALDMTIGSLYGITVSHKLSNKQRNVFQRYVRIAVARARHPQLFESVSLGAVKYVKANEKRVEVKLSVKDMQYEAKNEEESERRKIIRLLKRAGAEQDLKKKEDKEKAKKESTLNPVKSEKLKDTPPVAHPDKEKPTPVDLPSSNGKTDSPIKSKLSPEEKESKLTKKKISPVIHKKGLSPLKRDLATKRKKEMLRQPDMSEKKDVLLAKVERKDSDSQKMEPKPDPTKTEDNQSKENREVVLKVEEGTTKTSADHPDGVCFNAKDSKKAKVTFRDKFSACSYCQSTIQSRIRICSGCKKVCYCDSKCQKSHWKVHKKECLYALAKEEQKELTG